MLSSLSSTIMTVLDIPQPSDSPGARANAPDQSEPWDRGLHAPAFTQAPLSRHLAKTSADVLRKRKHRLAAKLGNMPGKLAEIMGIQWFTGFFATPQRAWFHGGLRPLPKI